MKQEKTTEQHELDKEIAQFRWVVGTAISIILILIGIIYGFLQQADKDAANKINSLETAEQANALHFQNIDYNLLSVCRTLKADCIPYNGIAVTTTQN